MIGAWLLEHLVEEAGCSRGSLSVLAIHHSEKASCRPYFPFRPFFFLGSREAEALVASSFSFPLAFSLEKIAPTTSSLEAKLVVMLSSWLVLVGVLRSSSFTKSLQVVPAMNAPMTSESLTLGSSVHLEKRLMKSQRDSLGFWR